jgi:YD repeat-containing protein
MATTASSAWPRCRPPAPAGGTSTLNTFYSYDNAGNIAASTDPMGFVSTMTWDLLSRETSASAPDASSGASGGPETTMACFAGPDGDEMTSVDPNGNAAGNSSEHTSITVMDTFGRTYQTSEPSPDGTTAGPTVT